MILKKKPILKKYIKLRFIFNLPIYLKLVDFKCNLNLNLNIFNIFLIFNFYKKINSLVLNDNFIFFKNSYFNFYFYKNNKSISLLKTLIFDYLKYFFILFFLIFKKNIKSLFFINFYSNINNYYYSIKNIFNKSYNNIIVNFKKENTFKTVNTFLNNSSHINSIKNLNNLFKNFFNLFLKFNKNSLIFNKLLNYNFYFSFFFIWKFLLFFPFSNILINLNYNKLNFFNTLTSNKILKKLFKNNFLIFKYFNFFNFNIYHNSFIKTHYCRVLKFKIYKFLKDSQFSDLLVRLVENISNFKTLIFINRSLYEQLTFKEWVKFDILRRRFWSSVRVHYWKLNTRYLQQPITYAYGKMPSPAFYWFEITLICFLFYKLKDVTILITYLFNKMKRMSLFKHRNFLRRIFFILRVLFYEIGPWYAIEGVKIKLIGKISVTGNARTRTMHFKEGLVSNSNMNIRSDYNFTIINTNTGCLGLSIWLFF